ncbi:MAG TPA: hypothetical protein DEA96_10075 [Leptospiraceae bacterium]|nr:hypothetical protein [Spirochaetaceae bacterium]HBS05303.1 hypothetical protein [Leptospiraceae bacterium]|tara:strand:- start:29564 stop:30574 length:1011 start_codon:yes stop_codon:yes gene_type:complete
MDEYLNCLVDVPLPELDGQSATEFNEFRQSVKPVREVSGINLEYTRNVGEAVFQGVPDESELARTFGCTPYRAKQILNFEVHCFRMMRIRLESVSYEISRKTEGYLVAGEELLGILEERIRRQVNGILNLNASLDQAVEQFGDYFMDHVTVLEGTHDGKLIRFYLAIRQMQAKMDQFEMFGTSQFHEVLERRLLKRLESSDVGTVSVDASQSPAKERDFPEPPRDRRAEDSAIWKKFEQDQLGAAEDTEPREGSISWAASFSALGPFFTVRILLRRGLYPEILHWLHQDEGRFSPELPRILSDCLKAEQHFRERTNEAPDGLLEVIGAIKQVLRET